MKSIKHKEKGQRQAPKWGTSGAQVLWAQEQAEGSQRPTAGVLSGTCSIEAQHPFLQIFSTAPLGAEGPAPTIHVEQLPQGLPTVHCAARNQDLVASVPKINGATCTCREALCASKVGFRKQLLAIFQPNLFLGTD